MHHIIVFPKPPHPPGRCAPLLPPHKLRFCLFSLLHNRFGHSHLHDQFGRQQALSPI
ncbi:UNVERIFIED_CONTAM: hypothetical protein Slati_2442000 [Sesamum latifolium]|uniref:Uncharacterized protein n=1 Tax=Sesamum latifolium TaxID=2727402 RepID=A0AAW2WHC5_9LAMI